MLWQQLARSTASIPWLLLIVVLAISYAIPSAANRVAFPGGFEGVPSSSDDAVSAAAEPASAAIDPATFKPPFKSSRWLLFPARDKLKWNVGSPRTSWRTGGWLAAFQQFWDYALMKGPPLFRNGALQGSACLQGQDSDLWVTSASDLVAYNISNKDCTLSTRKYRYIYVSIYGSGYIYDPNMLRFKQLMDVAQQCSSWVQDAVFRNSKMIIKDVNTGKVFYDGSMAPMITKGNWLQTALQAYDGTCGEGGYTDPENNTIPWTQGYPDFAAAKGKHVYVLPNGYPNNCAVKGSKPGYLATAPPAAFDVSDRGSIVSYTNMNPPIRPNNFPLDLVPLNDPYKFTFSFTSMAFAIDIRRFKASRDYNPSKGLHLSMEWSVDVPDARIFPSPNNNLDTFCTLCYDRCSNYCKEAVVDGDLVTYDPCKVTANTRVPPVNITVRPRPFELKVMLS